MHAGKNQAVTHWLLTLKNNKFLKSSPQHTWSFQALQTQELNRRKTSFYQADLEAYWSNSIQYCSTSDQHCFPASNQSKPNY